MRSVLIGDCDRYLSEYVFGVAQGMTLLGHWHTSVNIRQPLDVIVQRVEQVRPDVVWGHMLLWAPEGATASLLTLCADWRRRWGAQVLIHDGDARADTRHPFDLSAAVDLALCNHTASRAAWRVPQLRWPYGAFVQPAGPAAPDDALRCRLAFAGRLGGGLYAERTAAVDALRARLGAGMRVFPSPQVLHTLFCTPELAASADAVLGWGRPDAPGWLDVRVFQYPGAGGVLLHDDVGGFLEPLRHYVPFARTPGETAWAVAARVLDALAVAREHPGIRQEAYAYVQARHTVLHRVRAALLEVGLDAD